MWTCSKCGEKIEDQFDACWKCSTSRAAAGTASAGREAAAPGHWLAFRTFRGTLASWDQLFSEAAEFATEVGRGRVLTISHSADNHDGVVTVWYWASQSEPTLD